MGTPKLEEVPEEPSLGEVVRSQAAQIEKLIAALDSQRALFEMVLAGQGRAIAQAMTPALPVHPPCVDTLTIADLWRPYLASLGDAKWVRNVELLMQKPLRHFAPSICPKKFPSRRYRHVVMQGPDMLVSALRPSHWLAFRDRLRETDDCVGVTTRNLMLTRTQAMLNWSCATERIAANPLAGVKQEPRKPRRETTITSEQLDRMLEAEDSLVFRGYMFAASDSGMRNAEVRLLQWDQIDFATGRVSLSWTLTKSKRSRIARLSPRALDAIRALPRTSEYVFASPRGGPYSESMFWRWFRRAAAAVGIVAAPGDSRVHFHDATRHTFATRMHKAGATIKEIQVALGHSSIQTTALYLHTDEDALDKAHALLHNAERKGPSNKPNRKTPPDE